MFLLYIFFYKWTRINATPSNISNMGFSACLLLCSYRCTLPYVNPYFGGAHGAVSIG